jgi:hypothetical protein
MARVGASEGVILVRARDGCFILVRNRGVYPSGETSFEGEAPRRDIPAFAKAPEDTRNVSSAVFRTGGADVAVCGCLQRL